MGTVIQDSCATRMPKIWKLNEFRTLKNHWPIREQMILFGSLIGQWFSICLGVPGRWSVVMPPTIRGHHLTDQTRTTELFKMNTAKHTVKFRVRNEEVEHPYRRAEVHFCAKTSTYIEMSKPKHVMYRPQAHCYPSYWFHERCNKSIWLRVYPFHCDRISQTSAFYNVRTVWLQSNPFTFNFFFWKIKLSMNDSHFYQGLLFRNLSETLWKCRSFVDQPLD